MDERNNNNGVDLSLVPMNDLVRELAARHDSLVVMGQRLVAENIEAHDTMFSIGSVAACVGLAHVYISQALRGVRTEPGDYN